MKRGIEVTPDYDEQGRWCLRLKKQKGHFTVDELVEALSEWEWDFYAVILKCIPFGEDQYFEYVDYGDYITAYRATDFLGGGP
jgi:hypothetical protein